MNKHIALLTFVLTLFSSSLSAEEGRRLKPLEDYKHKYETEWVLLVSTLDAKKNLSFKKKLVRYEEGVSRLKQLFVVERINEYDLLF